MVPGKQGPFGMEMDCPVPLCFGPQNCSWDPAESHRGQALWCFQQTGAARNGGFRLFGFELGGGGR